MSRWEPKAQDRLERAALDLFGESGYEKTTAAQIAQRAGLTERTFFRHFADKREVLFTGAAELQALVTENTARAPDAATPLEAVVAGLKAADPLIHRRRESARRRQAVIGASADLQERELVKLAALAAALAEVLRLRGETEPRARLTAEVGVTAFKVAFERWADGGGHHDFRQCLQEALHELSAVTGRPDG